MNSQIAVREYIEDIVARQNVDPQTTEGQEWAAFLYQELDRFTKEAIINALPLSKLDEFAQLVSTHASSQTLHDFAHRNIPQLDEVFLQAFLKFRDFYLGNEVTHARS